MNIYELTGQFKQLQVMLESGDIDQETFDDTLETLSFTLEEKAENYGLIITNLSSHAEALKGEAKRLMERANQLESNVTRLKDNLLDAMIQTGNTKFKTDHFSFSTRKSTATLIEVPTEALALEFVKEKVTLSADKTAIKKAIESGQVVLGARLIQNTSISIK